MNRLYLLCFALATVTTSFRPPSTVLSADLAHFEYMLGKWEGKGQCLLDQQLFKVKRILYAYPEKQGRQIRITSLTIEDEPLNIENRLVQQQQHTISFHPKRKTYTIKTHSNHQLVGQAALEVPFKGFCAWKPMENVRCQVRYERGRWIESAEMLKTSQGWVQIATSELEKF